eukprot:827125-Karenia_brevis.AAC.1
MARPQSGHLINMETTRSQPVLILLDTRSVSAADHSQQILSRRARAVDNARETSKPTPEEN